MTEYVLSLSYGKDSLACLGAIEKLGWPLDRIIHSEVWATDDIPADIPPMMEFKTKADEIIKARWGVEVEHIHAMKNGEKLTYEKIFYHIPKRKDYGGFPQGSCAGFPYTKGAWCNDRLKTGVLDKFLRSSSAQGASQNIVQYLGIAADEPKRIAKHQKPGFALPLVDAGWDEAYCRQWCEENHLLSPIYTTAARGGCWFCHNQCVGQLRLLRENYPDLWELLLRWDLDSPVSFRADGHTVHDLDRRFRAEDAGLISPDGRKFRWSMLDDSKTKQGDQIRQRKNDSPRHNSLKTSAASAR